MKKAAKHDFAASNKRLRKALKIARECIEGHFDDGCSECRMAIACIDAALSTSEHAAGGKNG